MGSKNLLRVDKEKDLGVDVCANFKWNVHTHTIICKANRMLGQLKRTCPLLTSVRFDEHYTLRMSGHNYATLVKSGLQTQSNLVRELKVSKEKLARRYLTIIIENLHTNKD